MRHRPGEPAPGSSGAAAHVLRVAGRRDARFIAELADEVFGVFGEYGAFLPRYLDHPGVLTTICEVAGRPVGFLMTAVVTSNRPMPWQEPGARGEWLDLELVAIGVSPDAQGAGVGTVLMERAVHLAATCRPSGARSLQLNVAHTNRRAMDFFTHRGFLVVNPFDGTYPRGQRSIRMARPI